MAVAPASAYVLIAEEKTVALWSLQDGKLKRSFPVKEKVTSVAYAPDGKHIVTGGVAGTIRVWSLLGKEVAQLSDYKEAVRGLAFSPDGKWIASCGDGIKMWEWQKPRSQPAAEPNKEAGASGELLRGHEGAVTSVAFCDGGKKIVSGGSDKTVRVWDRESRKEAFPLKEFKAPVASLGVLADGKTVYVGLTNGAGESLVIDAPGTRSLGSSDGTVARAIAASPDGRCVGRVGAGIGLQLLVPTPATVESHGSSESINAHSLAFSPDGQRVAVGEENGTITLYDVDDKYTVRRLKQIAEAHKGPVRGLAFVPDTKELISAGEDGKLIVWDVTTGKEARRYDTPRGAITSLAITRDGKYVAAGVKEGNVHIWPVAEPKPSRVLPGELGVVRGVAFSPDGKWLAASGDGIRLWEWQKSPPKP
jgi:WD40 repeat protein